MTTPLRLRDIMTPVPYRIDSEQSLAVAKQELSKHNVRHLPVMDGDSVVGMLSERDIALAVAVAKHVVEEEQLKVKDVCTLDPYSVDINERFDVVLQSMGKNRFGSAIVTESGQMVGIITTTDVCRVCGEYFHEVWGS